MGDKRKCFEYEERKTYLTLNEKTSTRFFIVLVLMLLITMGESRQIHITHFIPLLSDELFDILSPAYEANSPIHWLCGNEVIGDRMRKTSSSMVGVEQ